MDNSINPTYVAVTKSRVKIPRSHVKLTHNPNTAKSGETLIIKVPALATDEFFHGNTFKLTFDYETSTAVTNIVSSMVDSISYKLNGIEILNMNKASIINVYKDMWIPSPEEQYLHGAQNANTMKLRHGVTGADADIANDKLMSDIYKKRYELLLNHVILNHPFAPESMDDSFEIVLTLSSANAFELKSICLEFDKSRDEDIVKDLVTKLTSYYSYYSEEFLIRQDTILAADTNKEFNLTLSNKSIGGILLLFIDSVSKAPVFPNLTNIGVDIDGMANTLHTTGLSPADLYAEAAKYFRGRTPDEVTPVKFYEKPIVYLDMRTYTNSKHVANGREIKHNVNIKMTKAATTNNLTAYIFLVRDRQLYLVNNRFESVTF